MFNITLKKTCQCNIENDRGWGAGKKLHRDILAHSGRFHHQKFLKSFFGLRLAMNISILYSQLYTRKCTTKESQTSLP